MTSTLVYKTIYGETLDQIAYKHYGNTDSIPQILESNRGLADQPEILPPNLLITLPAGEPKQQESVKLWD